MVRIAALIITGYVSFILGLPCSHATEEIPLGQAYQGPKCMISVGDFSVRVQGAPNEIADGLREMLQTALFESNYFFVMDLSTSKGISVEKFLSDPFLSDADAILKQGQTQKVAVSVYAAVTLLEGGGWGLRGKVPGAPLKLGGAYHKAKITIELRVVDSASGRLIAALSVKGDALSGKGMVGTMASECSLPMTLNLIRNTPLELAIRDCIYRAVIGLCKTIPNSMFRHRGLDILIKTVE